MTSADGAGPGSIIELPESECVELLRTTTVGRLAFVNHEGQQLIPVNFALIDGVACFRTAPDGIVASLAEGHGDVAFGVDHSDEFREGWNVTVRESASRVEDQGMVDRVLALHLLRPWAGGIRPLVIKVTPHHIAGRRVSGNR